MIAFLYRLVFGFDNTLDPLPFYGMSLIFGLLLSAVLLRIRKRPEAPREQIQKTVKKGPKISLWLSVAILLSFPSYVALSRINCGLDTSPAESRTVELVDKYYQHYRRTPDDYFITVDLDPDNRPEMSPIPQSLFAYIRRGRQTGKYYTELRITEDVYNTLPKRGQVTIAIHPGALGYTWIGTIELAHE